MSKTGLDDLSERLIAADSPVSDAAYQKYRMQLEDKLKRAERMQRRAWWTMIGLWIVSLLSVALVVQLGNVWRIKMPEWYGAFSWRAGHRHLGRDDFLFRPVSAPSFATQRRATNGVPARTQPESLRPDAPIGRRRRHRVQ